MSLLLNPSKRYPRRNIEKICQNVEDLLIIWLISNTCGTSGSVFGKITPDSRQMPLGLVIDPGHWVLHERAWMS